MRKPVLTLSLLTFALVASGCASRGEPVRPQCPKLPPIPASLLVKPMHGQKARSILLETPTTPTPKSAPCKNC